jgi:predicted O-linked N-acetylglucosamine transferase (SPINDLY family)
VPIVTLAGSTPSGRTSAAILSHLELVDFIADTPQAFVDAAVNWAGKQAALGELRATMRERMRGSALARPDLLAANLSAMVRLMWRRWCEGKPPAPLVLESSAQHGTARNQD